MELKELGRRIRIARSILDLRMGDMPLRSALQKVEDGISGTTFENLSKIAHALSMNSEDLLGPRSLFLDCLRRITHDKLEE